MSTTAMVMFHAIGLGVFLTMTAGQGEGKAEASPPARAATVKMAPWRERWPKACAKDLDTTCAAERAVAGGQGCLFANEDRLTDQCYDVFIREARVMALCVPDLNRFCRGPEVRVTITARECLTAHMAELSPLCKLTYEPGIRLPKSIADYDPSRHRPTTTTPVKNEKPMRTPAAARKDLSKRGDAR